MRILMMAVALAAFLSACTTIAEQAAEAQRDVDRMVQIYGPACEKLGFKSGTDPWRNCIIGLGQRDAARYSARYGPPYGYYYPYW
jgi:hypothetical protein